MIYQVFGIPSILCHFERDGEPAKITNIFSNVPSFIRITTKTKPKLLLFYRIIFQFSHNDESSRRGELEDNGARTISTTDENRRLTYFSCLNDGVRRGGSKTPPSDCTAIGNE